jgi:flagellar biosynthesis protein FliR
MPAYLTADILGYFFVFCRIGAMAMLLPAIGEDQAPVRVRLIFALLLSAVVYPAVFVSLPAVPDGFPGTLAIVFTEILLGLMIGGAVRILMQALHVGGTIVAIQTGFAAAVQFDPSQGGQVTVITRFLGLLGVVMIFATGLHHLLIGGMVKSYALFRPGTGIMTADMADMVTTLVAQSFLLGIQISAPFLAFGIIFNVGLGLMSRLAPQIQVFFIAQPLSIMTGVALLLASLGAMMTAFTTAFADALRPLLGG